MTIGSMKYWRSIFPEVGAAIIYGALVSSAGAQSDIQHLRTTFASPPASARPMVRWWWFGPAVVKPEIARELDAMHAAGIGGVELAAEYPLALDDPAKGIVNLRYGSPEYVDLLRFANQHATELGMRVDLTLGSGWPFGGPNIPIDLAAGRLRFVAVALPSPASALPKLAGESFIAAFVAKGTAEQFDTASAQRIPGDAIPRELARPEGSGPQVELFFIASHTRQQVKRLLTVKDLCSTMARPAIDHYLKTRGDVLLGGFSGKPYAIFSGLAGGVWVGLDEGPSGGVCATTGIRSDCASAGAGAEEARRKQRSVRHDWGLTLSELVRDNYLRPMAEYATTLHDALSFADLWRALR